MDRKQYDGVAGCDRTGYGSLPIFLSAPGATSCCGAKQLSSENTISPAQIMHIANKLQVCVMVVAMRNGWSFDTNTYAELIRSQNRRLEGIVKLNMEKIGKDAEGRTEYIVVIEVLDESKAYNWVYE